MLVGPCVDTLSPRVVVSPFAGDWVREGTLDDHAVTIFPSDRAGRERCANFLHAGGSDTNGEYQCLAAALDADGSSLAALAAALAP
eukprot:9457832-Alexandrium_andersonii.AAC.1